MGVPGTDATTEQNDESLSMGVSLAIAALKFYKREFIGNAECILFPVTMGSLKLKRT